MGFKAPGPHPALQVRLRPYQAGFQCQKLPGPQRNPGCRDDADRGVLEVESERMNGIVGWRREGCVPWATPPHPLTPVTDSLTLEDFSAFWSSCLCFFTPVFKTMQNQLFILLLLCQDFFLYKLIPALSHSEVTIIIISVLWVRKFRLTEME